LLQSLLGGANQILDITNDPEVSSLLGLTWDEIKNAFPTRVQELADSVHNRILSSGCKSLPPDVLTAFGISMDVDDIGCETKLETSEMLALQSMTSEQRLESLRIIIKDRFESQICCLIF
jgi:hypothetical protein